MPSPLTPAELAGHTLLTIERAAEVTGWSRAALYAAVRLGAIPSYRLPGATRGTRLRYPDVLEAARATPHPSPPVEPGAGGGAVLPMKVYVVGTM